ncbi:type II secretion system F family protein [Candidatus Micrarchaeota archaeon]|nr:type II secretion system F family protein [Candidatus Micrarchaeota archaeon]
MGIYDSIGRLTSRGKVLKMKKELDAAGINVSAETYLGFLTVVVILISLMLTFFIVMNDITLKYLLRFTELIGISKEQKLFGAMVLVFAFIISLIVTYLSVKVFNYVLLSMRKDSRRKAVEQVLPDFLLLSSANVRAGMTIDQALWYAAKPEFGLLSEEVTVLAKRSFAGEPIDKSLDSLASRFDSRVLKRAVALVKQALASGGEIAKVLEKTGEDARKMQILRKDIAASLLMYVIFIAFASAFAAPFLFSVAHQLVERLETVFAQIPNVNIQEMTQQLSSMGGTTRTFINIQISSLPITSKSFFMFSVVMLVVTVTFSSLIIGAIQKGSKKEGLKYLPLLLIVSVVVYMLTNGVLSTILKYITI